MVKGKNGIIGLFWHKDRDSYPFTGNLELNADGNFKGETSDAFGRTIIKGSLTKDLLVFTKRYQPHSLGLGNPILSELRPIEPSIDGGWKGTCTIAEVNGSETVWQTACMILPC